MSDVQDLAQIMNAPTDLEGFARVIVRTPSFDEVREAAGESWGRDVTVAYIGTTFLPGGTARSEYSEMKLNSIRDVTYNSECGEFSFTARYTSSHEHSSYNQSSVRTTHTYYQVTVREGFGESHMHVISDPHPHYRAW